MGVRHHFQEFGCLKQFARHGNAAAEFRFAARAPYRLALTSGANQMEAMK